MIVILGIVILILIIYFIWKNLVIENFWSKVKAVCFILFIVVCFLLLITDGFLRNCAGRKIYNEDFDEEIFIRR
jgi:hypothetical protein